MLRALFAGISGLRNHQLKLDVIGNNIANVGTVGFKGSRVTFQTGFSQLLAQATAATDERGGIDPQQVGSGSRVGSIDSLFTQGAFQATGRPLDLAIQGDGFFVVGNAEQSSYTRAGNFQLDARGRVVLGSTGLALQGSLLDGSGSPAGSVGDLQIDLESLSPPRATSEVVLSGNLDADAEAGTTQDMLVTVYDPNGTAYDLDLTFAKQEDGSWTWTLDSETLALASSVEGTVTFNGEGTLEELLYPGGESTISVTTEGGVSFDVSLVADGSSGFAGLTAYSGETTAAVVSQDGRQASELVDLRIDADGTLNGVYANGEILSLARLALATFPNPSGLIQNDGNLFALSSSSGEPVVGFSGDTTTSAVISGALEGSNVDVAEEFTHMIVAQRGYQANARVITAADEMLSEVINLRR